MKRTRSVARAIGPAKPIQGLVLSEEVETQLQVESNLSPERIMDGASNTTALLNQILAQQEELHQLRDWGINE
jgi:hypothetical protein